MLHIDLSRRYFLTLLGSGLVASTAAARAQPLIVDVKVGREKATDSLLSLVSRAAHTDDAVLISGGTSAEMESIARAIHKRSPRAGRFFVPMRNLASIPPTLIPAELVGHEKLKAAVGTIRWRPGRIELAHLGTLFIHDITELPRDMVLHCSGYGILPIDLQLVLLRALQERSFTRLTGTEIRPADVRIIAATSGDPSAAVAEGTLRSDLFDWLSAFRIQMPRLRERGQASA